MSHKPNALSKQLVVAAALALGASSVALADDNSMSRFGGNSYAYFNQPVLGNSATNPTWRQSHPNGLTERDLQALSSSDLSASASQLSPPVFARAPADPSLRQSLSERDLEALSSSTLARWQPLNGSGNVASAAPAQASVAQAPAKETFSPRYARIYSLGM